VKVSKDAIGPSMSWPDKSAKRVFAIDVPAIHVFDVVK